MRFALFTTTIEWMMCEYKECQEDCQLNPATFSSTIEWVDGAEEVEVERKQSLSGSPHQGIKIMMLV